MGRKKSRRAGRGPGRNDPCPCGSGKKHKVCCLAEQRRPPFTERDRAGALHRMFSRLDEDWEDAFERAREAWFGPYLGRPMQDHAEENVAFALDFWFCFDREEPTEGRRPVDAMLRYRGLTPGERAYLTAVAKSRMSLYEVVDVRPGASITLRDLLTEREVQVRERSASRSVRRWDVVGARVFVGASGQPEIDGGLFPYNPAHREQLLLAARDAFAEHGPRAKEHLPPLFAQQWMAEALDVPRVQMGGHEVKFTTLSWEVVDRGAVLRALAGIQRIVPREGEADRWTFRDGDGGPESSWRGDVDLEADRLVCQTPTVEDGVQLKALIEDASEGALREAQVTTQSLTEAMAQHGAALDAPEEPVPEELNDAALDFYARHYRDWLDEPVPALGGRTPRQAARIEAEHEGLTGLLKGLETMYTSALSQGLPAYDPTWMWEELGLGDHPDAPAGRAHPPMAHERMPEIIDGFGALVEELARKWRKRASFDTWTVLTQEDLEGEEAFRSFVDGQAVGWSDPADLRAHLNLVCTHLHYAVNFELHLRKTFHVAPALAWMLGETDLDLSGDLLRMPFASFAVVCTDRRTLGLAERLLGSVDDCELRGQMLQVMSVYVTRWPSESGTELQLSFAFDALAGQWPYLVTRELSFGDDDDLEQILASRPADLQGAARDPVFTSPILARLAKLVVAAVLYATSAEADKSRREGAGVPGPRRRADEVQTHLSSEEVFYLPGHITISEQRMLASLERTSSGRRMLHRYMVRGHWRRANPAWKDQRPRWIAPYWKGPKLATIIERAYRLEP